MILIRIFLLVSMMFLVVYNTLQAHELIPRALQEYIQTHPEATADEIKEFASSQAPEFASRFQDWADILRIIKDTNTSFIDNMFDFFRVGVAHILSGPDHILFILSLLLVFVSWKDILKLTSVFTLAHSITLILAGTWALVLSSSIVEPMIALSIAYVAFTSVFLWDNVFLWGSRSKMIAIFFFGLFHGLGFAGLLREIDIPWDKFISSLLAFNLGIEWGQLVIVALAFPIVYTSRNKTWYRRAIQVFSIVIIAIAMYWIIERVMQI